jgi:hypothetical protein
MEKLRSGASQFFPNCLESQAPMTTRTLKEERGILPARAVAKRKLG